MAGFFVKMMCVLPLAMCSEPRNWDFVQSVGGLEIKNAVRQEDKWMLDINADVSGLSEITVKPTLVNSALICESTSAKVDGDEIFLTINTGVIREGYSANCPSADLGNIKDQTYQVYYKGDSNQLHPMGQLVINTQTGSEWLWSKKVPSESLPN